MAIPDGDLPEAASRRMGEGAFTSGLSVPDFAACLQMGLQPVGFVQGSCVMQWRWYGMGGLGSPFNPFGQWTGTARQQGAYQQNFPCPHGFVSAEHRLYGQNVEQTWIEDAWSQGFAAAYDRMIEEASLAGAHGVVGVIDSWRSLTDMGVLEFRLRGTAVRIDGQPPNEGDGPWTTYLAGQRLAKLVEAGYAPVTVAAAVASVRVWASCMTEYLAGGTTAMWGGQMAGSEITQVAEAQMAVRQLAREHIRSQLGGGDSLHGASMVTTASEVGEGDADLQCIVRGNRVRRFKRFEPLPPPLPTVRLQ
jgi:uncharacterized protein YbjQ (UPF0145 family)